MSTTALIITTIIIMVVIIAIVWWVLSEEYCISTPKELVEDYFDDKKIKYFHTIEGELIKQNNKRNKIIYLFLDKNHEKKYILILKKRYLKEEYIPEEFFDRKCSQKSLL